MKRYLISVVLLSTVSLAFAQEKFTIAGGGGAKNGSTYSDMLGTIAGTCSTDEMPLEELPTNGGVKNLELIRANKVKGALVPSDLLFAAKMENASSVANIFTIFGMHPEEVHLVARGGVKTEGGVTVFGKNLGGKDIVYNNPEDLKGRPVGAVGGSAETARILGDLLRIGWTVQKFESNAELVRALTAKTIDAALFSVGAPSPAIAALPPTFKLLPLRGNSDTAAVYSPAKLQYANLNGNRAVDTLSSQALLVSRTFRAPETLAALAALRKCLTDNLGKIQDKSGTHPAWQNVSLDNRGKWQWYELPSAAPTPAEAPATKSTPSKIRKAG